MSPQGEEVTLAASLLFIPCGCILTGVAVGCSEAASAVRENQWAVLHGALWESLLGWSDISGPLFSCCLHYRIILNQEGAKGVEVVVTGTFGTLWLHPACASTIASLWAEDLEKSAHRECLSSVSGLSSAVSQTLQNLLWSLVPAFWEQVLGCCEHTHNQQWALLPCSCLCCGSNPCCGAPWARVAPVAWEHIPHPLGAHSTSLVEV